MPDRDHPDLAEIEALSTFLDAASATGDAPRPTGRTRLPDDLAMTARAVRAASRPRGLTRRFADRLEEDLMDLAALERSHAGAADTRPTPRSPLPARIPIRSLPVVSRSRGLVELASFAAIITLLFGQVMGFGGSFAFWQDASPTPASTGPTTGLTRVDAGRSGAFSGPGPSGTPALRWVAKQATDYALLDQPVAGENTLFVLDPANGVISEVAGEGALSPRVAQNAIATYLVDHDTVYVTTGVGDRGTLSAHGPGYLTQRWGVETGVSAAALGFDGERIFMTDTSGVLHAFSADDGTSLWSVDLAVGRLDSVFQPPSFVLDDPSPAVADGMVFVGTPGGVHAFAAVDGTPMWTTDLPEALVGAPSIVGGAVFVAARGTGSDGTPGTGHVYALDAVTGVQRWSYAQPAWKSAVSKATGVSADDVLVLTVDGDSVFVNGDGETGDVVTALDVATGDETWSVRFGVVSGAAPVAAGDTLYLTRPDGGVYGLNSATGERRWRLDAGTANLRSPAIIGDLLLVTTANGTVFGLGDATDDTSAAGTPTAASNGSDDISGLAPCAPPRLRPDPPPTGEPATTLDVLQRPESEGQGSAVRADLPTKPVADADAFVGILDTLHAMRACDRPGKERELGGFFTDDYYRRMASYYPDTDILQLPWVARVPYGFAQTRLEDLPDPVVLDDGRVALLLGWRDVAGERGANWGEGQLVVFVRQHGVWMIDEVVRVTEVPNQPMG